MVQPSTPPYYAAIARSWLNDEAAAPALEQVARAIATHSHDSGGFGSPTQRRRKIVAARKAAMRLREHLDEIDPTTRLALFGKSASDASRKRISEPEAISYAAEIRMALDDQGRFWRIMDGLIRQAGAIRVDMAPKSSVGPRTPDAIAFGIEWLAAIWRRYRSETPDNSSKRDGFGSFVEAVLGPPSTDTDQVTIRTALRHHFATPG